MQPICHHGGHDQAESSHQPTGTLVNAMSEWSLSLFLYSPFIYLVAPRLEYMQWAEQRPETKRVKTL